MAGRIIIKPYFHRGITGGNMETCGESVEWTARPEFNYAGMPAIGKPHFGKGRTPFDAVRNLARFMPKELREMLLELKAENIYPRPDCEIRLEHKIVEMDGYVPDDNEWHIQRAWYERRGDLRSYFKMKEERELLNA